MENGQNVTDQTTQRIAEQVTQQSVCCPVLSILQISGRYLFFRKTGKHTL